MTCQARAGFFPYKVLFRVHGGWSRGSWHHGNSVLVPSGFGRGVVFEAGSCYVTKARPEFPLLLLQPSQWDLTFLHHCNC